MKRALSFIAAFLVFSGFGMIHAGTDLIEKMGSVLIGLGALYFLILLYKSIKKDEEKESSDQTTL